MAVLLIVVVVLALRMVGAKLHPLPVSLLRGSPHLWCHVVAAVFPALHRSDGKGVSLAFRVAVPHKRVADVLDVTPK
jgi:hypothetical protein